MWAFSEGSLYMYTSTPEHNQQVLFLTDLGSAAFKASADEEIKITGGEIVIYVHIYEL